MRQLIDRILRTLNRLVLVIFFRRIEVVGREKIPAAGPLLLLGNHINSLIDPLLLIYAGPRMPRFLAKSTLWKMAPLRPFLNLAAAIPVYRRQDAGVDTGRNSEMFARCHELLRDGGAIALFPEGTSHNEPHLQPLKTGAARIALEAEERFGPLGVQILPVGLIFDDKAMFRSRALVRVGNPIPLVTEGQSPQPAPPLVHALTERMDEGLRQVTLNYESWHEAELVERAAELYGRQVAEVPGEGPLARRVEMRQAFLEGYRQLKRAYPERVQATAAAVEEYDDLLRALDLRDDQVAAMYEGGRVARWLLHTAYGLLVFLPLAALGFALNSIPYRLPSWVARRFAPSEDAISTYKVFSGLFLYPLFWLGEGAVVGTLVGRLAGPFWGFFAAFTLLLLGPLSGWFALRFLERQKSLVREARAFLLLRHRQGKTLRAQRREIFRQVEELVHLQIRAQQEQPTDDGSTP